MGNRGSLPKGEKNDKETPTLPKITVTGASPLPAEGAVFTLPGPGHTDQPGPADGLSPAKAEQITPNRSQVHCWNIAVSATICTVMYFYTYCVYLLCRKKVFGGAGVSLL